MMRVRTTGSKIKQDRSTTIITTIAPSLAKKAGGSIVGADRIYFYRRNKENECSYSIPNLVGRVYTLQLICHRYR